MRLDLTDYLSNQTVNYWKKRGFKSDRAFMKLPVIGLCELTNYDYCKISELIDFLLYTAESNGKEIEYLYFFDDLLVIDEAFFKSGKRTDKDVAKITMLDIVTNKWLVHGQGEYILQVIEEKYNNEYINTNNHYFTSKKDVIDYSEELFKSERK